jgi:Ca2+/Na+ antiporter
MFLWLTRLQWTLAHPCSLLLHRTAQGEIPEFPKLSGDFMQTTHSRFHITCNVLVACILFLLFIPIELFKAFSTEIAAISLFILFALTVLSRTGSC